MSLPITATWHKASFEHFIKESLLHLLAERIPLAGYTFEESPPHTCQLTLSLVTKAVTVNVTYDNIPSPDEEGVFYLDGQPCVVLPVAEHEYLEKATIDCVGEQLYRYIDERLGMLPGEIVLSEAVIRALMPLDSWIRLFFAKHAQPLDQQNWLARQQHLRRLRITERHEVITPGQFGRTCPFETPEGPNIGYYLHIALGAIIKDRKLVIVDERPEMALGLSAAMIPLLEHNDPAKLLMSANMLRQWMPSAEPEPALVQTGNEPQAQNFWCGRNLLTAFVSWGADTFEDAIVISESCARKLGYPTPVEPGDKLSNRHGMKGVVSRVLPDAEMPHLADGTPVELVFSFLHLHRRLYFGVIREAMLGRIAHARNVPIIVQPFHAPDAETLHAQLQQAGLPADGMEHLTLGHEGRSLPYPSAVGWVYWGRLAHTAASKVRVAVHDGPGQLQEQLAYSVLRDIEAYETIREHFNTCATGRPDANTLAERVTRGAVEQACAPTPQFADLTRRLAAAGISTELIDETLHWHFAPPQGPTLQLARPLPHPWLPGRMLSEIGICEPLPQYAALTEVNTRLEHMLHSGVPESLSRQVQAQLETRLHELFAALLTPQDLQFQSRVLFSARAVLAPASDVRLDQVGIGEQIAWCLFGPLVARELGAAGLEEVQGHSRHATERLDAIMARSWVLVYRSPALTPTAFLAFHPVRNADNVIRVHPLTCPLLNADFDGDQAALFLPITETGQQEAGERLSVIGHLRRDPALLRQLIPSNEAMWGLAALSLTTEGRTELAELLGTVLPTGLLTRTALYDLIKRILSERGEQQTLTILEQLTQRGFVVAQRSGASLSPFIGSVMQRPSEPANEDSAQWIEYTEIVEERIAARTDFANADGGPQLLTARSEAMSYTHFIPLLRSLIGPRGVVMDIHGASVPIEHGFSQGLTPREMFTLAAGSRITLARLAQDWEQHGSVASEYSDLHGFNVLVRAMRSQSPGVVFAHAAATGEIDPLMDIDSRLFVGLTAV